VTTRQQRTAYLEAMGIQAWVRRGPSEEADGPQPAQVLSPPAEAPVPAAPVIEAAPLQAETAPPAKASPPAEASPPAGWEEPPLPTEQYAPSLTMAEAGPESAPPARDVSRLDWPALEAAVASCTACDLHQTRTQTVFGVGDHHAQWMIIGEAPGAEEDKQGEPFVGRAGQLLNNMLQAIGLQREQVFIANILKCRPPNNRDPRPEEVRQCEAFLQRQVALVAPKVILALGRVAAHNLLGVDTPLSKLRGQVHRYGDTPLVVTYHPAYLLRSPKEKAKSWADLRFARSLVEGKQP
jgi:uracil-DNA glycosylase family 4